MTAIRIARTGEMLSVLLARDLRDGEKAIVGTNSDVQVAACNLARHMHALTLWWVSGPGGWSMPTTVSFVPPPITAISRAARPSWTCRR